MFGGSIGGGFGPPCPEAPGPPAAWCPPPIASPPFCGVEGPEPTDAVFCSEFLADCSPLLFCWLVTSVELFAEEVDAAAAAPAAVVACVTGPTFPPAS